MSATQPAIGRFFIVGCARSGTTLLQRLMAAHPQVQAFPEAHFFRSIIGDGGLKKALGIARTKGKRRLPQFLDEIGRPDLKKSISPLAPFTRYYIKRFTDVLDRIALENKKRYWVEKTPMNLYYTGIIARHIENARFIHIVRNGEDVVASLYDATNRHAQHWGGARDIGDCVSRWNRDMALTIECLNKTHHTCLAYENLVADPVREMKGLCETLGIAYHEGMLQTPPPDTRITLEHETWKHASRAPIKKIEHRKFDRLLDRNQRNIVKRKLDYGSYTIVSKFLDQKQLSG